MIFWEREKSRHITHDGHWNGECGVHSFQDTAAENVIWALHLNNVCITLHVRWGCENSPVRSLSTGNWLSDEFDIYPTLLIAKLVTKLGLMLELDLSFDAFHSTNILVYTVSFVHWTDSKWSSSDLVNTYGKQFPLWTIRLPNDTRF